MLTRIAEPTQKTERRLSVSLDLKSGYHFEADFGQPGVAPLDVDEAAPLGEGKGPNPAQMLAVAVANCLASSLLFCLRKSRIEVEDMDAFATATLARNEKGRLRVTAIDVTLRPQVAPADRPRMARCVEVFEDYCPVTAAVRGSLAVRVNVAPLVKADAA